MVNAVDCSEIWTAWLIHGGWFPAISSVVNFRWDSLPLKAFQLFCLGGSQRSILVRPWRDPSIHPSIHPSILPSPLPLALALAPQQNAALTKDDRCVPPLYPTTVENPQLAPLSEKFNRKFDDIPIGSRFEVAEPHALIIRSLSTNSWVRQPKNLGFDKISGEDR